MYINGILTPHALSSSGIHLQILHENHYGNVEAIFMTVNRYFNGITPGEAEIYELSESGIRWNPPIS